MSCILPIFFLLFGSSLSLAHQDQDQDDFIKTCPPTTCGSGPGSLQIRYPLRLQSAPASCGLRDLHLSCSGNDTLLTLPSLPPVKVTAIDYKNSILSVRIGPGFGSWSSSCPFKNLSSLDFLNTSRYSPNLMNISLLSCPRKLDMSSDSINFAGPILCLSRSDYFAYAVEGYYLMEAIPSGCVVVEGGGEFPSPEYYSNTTEENVEAFLERREVVLQLRDTPQENYYNGDCDYCEDIGKFCGYSLQRNHTFCYSPSRHGSGVLLIVGPSIGGLVLLVSVSIILFWVTKQFGKERETHLKVERFLAAYRGKPTRFTYSGI